MIGEPASTVPLRRLATCLDGKRIPLSREERGERPGSVPYWGAGGVIDSVAEALFDEALVLLGEDGAAFFEPGRPVAFLLDGPAWVNNHIHVLRPNPAVDRRFLVYALNAADYAAYITGSTRDKLTQDEMWQIRIPALPVDSQRAIANYLDRETTRIDALIAAKRLIVELLQERRHSSAASAVEQAKTLGPSRPLWTLMRPKEMTGAPHLEVLSVYRDFGVVPKSSRTDNYNKTPEDLSRYQVVVPGDVVINKMKAWQGSVGVSSHYGIVSPDYLVCELTVAIDSSYLHHALRSPQLRTEFQRRSEGIRPSQWRLQWDQLRLISLPVPQADDQRRIAQAAAREVMRRETLTDVLDTQLGMLLERRQALITAAVTGQFDIPEAA